MEEQEGRSRRQKTDRHGRAAAFEKLKQLKGCKNKYEVSKFDNVYEEVDEAEYSKTVLARQDGNWIIDDDGSGYVEDGREIFDDDLDDDSILFASKNNESGKHRGKKGGKKTKHEGKSNSIHNMLMNMPSKKRKRDAPVKLEDDDILGDIIEELNQGSSTGSASKKKAVETEMSPESYLRSLAANSTNRVKKIESPVNQFRSPTPQQLSSTPIRPKFERKHVTPRVIQTELEDKPPCVKKVEESDEEDTTIIEDTQPDNEIKQEMSSQIIEDFDSNDGFLENTNLDNIEAESMNVVKSEKVNGTSIADEMKTELATTITKTSFNSTSDPKPKYISDNQMLAGWETMMKSTTNISEDTKASISVSELPLTTTEAGDQALRFFWWDAYEEPFKQPGVVYLFGKVYVKTAKTYVSCCVVVKDINRKIYLLPREERIDLRTKQSTGKEVKFQDVYEEFNKTIAEKNKIHQFKCRKVERSYCFSVEDVPLVSEYLEIKYPAHHPVLPSDLQGETFSHVFGTRTSSLEHFLLERKIKGPCWLDIKECQAVTNPISWCKIEAVCNKMENIQVVMESKKLTPPPLTVLSLNFRSILNSKTSQNEIVMVGCLVHNSFPLDKAPPNPPFQEHFCVFTRSGDGIFPVDLKAALSKFRGTKMERTESERALLGFLVAKIFRIDPDLIVGHDLQGFGLDLLIHRLQANKIPHWSKVGRLRRSNIIMKGKHGFERQISSGRLVCDIKISAKELMRARSYDLGTLCEQVLHIKESERKDLTPAEVKIMYNSSNSLLQVASLTMQDAAYVLRLMCELNVIPLALQITNIAGNIMSRTLMGGRAERNEFLLLHAFYEKNYIVPDKEYSKKRVVMEDLGHNEDEGAVVVSKGRKKPAYAGGLVLEPKKGFYDTFVLLMDFNSLYPSIIQEYNICFTTVQSTGDKEAELPKPGLDPGILPTEIRKLVESRKAVKKLMKAKDLTSDLKLQYNIRQLALKLTANSMYGCLGFTHSRFYAKPLAALITAKGRDILVNTKDLVEKMGYEVIYGDTDSIMINTKCCDYDQVFKIGSKIKQDVNKCYRLVELDVDGVFKYLLLLKKKKYAAVTLSRHPNGSLITQQENKGLDIVRRDWSKISASAGSFVLEQILCDLPLDERIENIHNHLIQLKEDLENGKVPLELLTITKQLTKNVEEYHDNKTLPHVIVASRLNSSGTTKRFKQGDTVSYIICEDGTNNPATQRAYHVSELKANEKLKVDVKYYLSQQIHPVVSRLCDPIHGTDAALIAECLGLDPNTYKSSERYIHEDRNEDTIGENIVKSAEEMYKNCSKFKFICMNDKCNTENEVDGPIRTNGNDSELILEKCCNPKCTVPPYTYLPNILNKLTMTIRHYIELYYMSWLICEDPGCTNRTTQLPLWFSRGYPVCNLCHKGLMYREYSEADLFNQISYFKYIFTLKEHRKIQQETEAAYSRLSEQVDKFLSISGYDKYHLSVIFSFMIPPSNVK